MLKIIRQLYNVLSPSQKARFFRLQFLVVLSSCLEVIATTSIAPFMTLVGNIDILNGDNLLSDAFQLSGVETHEDFLFLAGICVILILATSNLINLVTIWRLSTFGNSIGVELSNRLYKYYLYKPWLFHASNQSSKLMTRVASDAIRVNNSIIQPLLAINSKFVLVTFLSLTIIAFDPKTAFIGISFLLFAYLVIFHITKPKLSKHGHNIARIINTRFALMTEGFGGIKDILVLGRQSSFTRIFESEGERLAKSQAVNKTLASSPKYVVELIAFSGIILLMISLIKSNEGDLGATLAPLAFYALAGYKLLPSIQAIYASIASMKTATASFHNIQDDLERSKGEYVHTSHTTTERVTPKKHIKLQDITFTYPKKEAPALNGLNIDIKANTTVGIVGASGSGKSTAIDILLGLITPDSGHILIDDITLNEQNLRSWQNAIGFVPQSIFLSNSSIVENIAYGIPKEEIDNEKAKSAIKLAHLDEFIFDLPDKELTKTGERGVQLSGGQRQRIGIARALYNNAEILIFDEATSALDNMTEKFIMDAIDEFSGSKTIIMIAHRLTTVKNCDVIYFMDNGKVVAQGTYDELLETNDAFRKMALQH